MPRGLVPVATGLRQGEGLMLLDTVDSPRQFQMWNYAVSHQQLVLQSNKREGFPTRVAIRFGYVLGVHLPTTLDGLTIWQATESEMQEMQLPVDTPLPHPYKVFVVRTKNFAGRFVTGHVVAGWMELVEDETEFNEPIKFHVPSP